MQFLPEHQLTTTPHSCEKSQNFSKVQMKNSHPGSRTHQDLIDLPQVKNVWGNSSVLNHVNISVRMAKNPAGYFQT